MSSLGVINLKAVLEGVLSLAPGSQRLLRARTLGTDSARYCYSVWLRHLVKAHPHRRTPIGGLVVELGPGDSLGTGLASLLSGFSGYVAIDVVRHTATEANLKMLEELIALFADRTPIPSSREFPEIKPHLDDQRFPSSILDAESMRKNLDTRRLQTIADSLQDPNGTNSMVAYLEPSKALDLLAPDSVAHLFSQAVLEHVDDLPRLYRTCARWLKQDGLMSHQIDFKSHGMSSEWNGHWAYPDALWRLARGKRPYLLNREPCGTHLRLIAESGFEVLAEERAMIPSRLLPAQLAARFRTMSEEDMSTAGVFILARKPRKPMPMRPC